MGSLLGRRQFLLVSAASLSGYAFYQWGTAATKVRGRIAVCYAIEPNPEKNDGSNIYGLLSLDLDSNVGKQTDTPFNVHDVAVHPQNGELAVGANKFGRHYGEFDIGHAKFLNRHKVKPELSLLGHMAYSDDGRFLCATAARDVSTRTSNRYQNEVLLLNPKTLAIEDSIRVPDFNPSQHDCRFLPDSHILATTAGNSIAYVDVSARKVETAKVAGLFPTSAIRHFGMSHDGKMAIQANVIGNLSESWVYNRGEIVVANRKQGRFEALRVPERLQTDFDREILDLCFDQTGDVFAVVAKGLDTVSFWNFKTGEVVAEVLIPRAARVMLTKDGKHFVVLARNGLRYVSASTYRHEVEMNQFEDFLSRQLPAGTYISHCRLT